MSPTDLMVDLHIYYKEMTKDVEQREKKKNF